eukprot:COSAG05_NODE_21555_length_271_cov_0.593023_1_plen_50_part_10
MALTKRIEEVHKLVQILVFSAPFLAPIPPGLMGTHHIGVNGWLAYGSKRH